MIGIADQLRTEHSNTSERIKHDGDKIATFDNKTVSG